VRRRAGGEPIGHSQRMNDSASFRQVKMPSLLTLDRGHGAISDFLICLPVQRDSHRKAGRAVVPNDLNAADALATRPLSNRLQTIFSEIRVAHSDRFEFYHLKYLSRKNCLR
jgi:hypothetical protein